MTAVQTADEDSFFGPLPSLRGNSEGQRPTGSTDELPLGGGPAGVGSLSPERFLPGGELAEVTSGGQFDWVSFHLTDMDLVISSPDRMMHGEVGLRTSAETEAYLELLALSDSVGLSDAALNAAVRQTETRAQRAAYETAFYEFLTARRMAYDAGTLRFTRAPDPAPGQLAPETLQPQFPYDPIRDMRTFPEHFVGRPVLLYGLYTQSGAVTIESDSVINPTRPRRLVRGFLKDLSGRQTVAMVDTTGFSGPANQKLPSTTWPLSRSGGVPVLIKGWFVKLWQRQPLIYCKSVRILTGRSYDEWIKRFSAPARRVTDAERWLYYETLQQLRLSSESDQRTVARIQRDQRIGDLMRQLSDRTVQQNADIEQQVAAGKLEQSRASQQIRDNERRLSLRLRRYRDYKADPDSFPAFVDLFKHPEAWQGMPVTLQGHVRKALPFRGDPILYGGGKLYELWLYTADSQHNPTVVVTASLPADFPLNAELVSGVEVTGTFFKMYVYESQDVHRLAPLLLAPSVRWSPDDEEIMRLAASGDLPEDSPRVAGVQKRETADETRTRTGRFLFGGLVLLLLMFLWGRVQRDRMQRKQLKSLLKRNADSVPGTIEPLSQT